MRLPAEWKRAHPLMIDLEGAKKKEDDCSGVILFSRLNGETRGLFWWQPQPVENKGVFKGDFAQIIVAAGSAGVAGPQIGFQENIG